MDGLRQDHTGGGSQKEEYPENAVRAHAHVLAYWFFFSFSFFSVLVHLREQKKNLFLHRQKSGHTRYVAM